MDRNDVGGAETCPGVVQPEQETVRDRRAPEPGHIDTDTLAVHEEGCQKNRADQKL